MNTIQVASLPVGEVITDIAQQLKTSVHESFGEYYLSLPPNIGSGTIRGLNIDGGLGILQYDCNFNEEMEIQFIKNEVHPLKFIYVITGELYHHFEDKKETHIIQQYKNAIVASHDGHGHILTFKKNMTIGVFSLEIDRAVFEKKTNAYKAGMNDRLKTLFLDTKASESFYYEGAYSLTMADMFKKIQDFEGNDFLRAIFMESIAYQTLLLQITQYLDDLRSERNQTVLRQSEIEKIRLAAAYIDTHLTTYKKQPELTKLTNLNGYKLQEGFKYLFDKTVNQYVFDARLNMAKELLLNSDLNISEIVYKIGLSSRSYFSSVFKKAYGIQPSSFRNTKK